MSILEIFSITDLPLSLYYIFALARYSKGYHEFFFMARVFVIKNTGGIYKVRL